METYINDSVKDNLLQLAKDCFPSTYSFDSDGSANLTNGLYDRLYSTDSYTGGDYTISTTGAWTDLDATNASVAITPELAGDFKFTFQFTVESVTSNATNEIDVRFRLTDGSTNSTATPRIKQVTGVTSTTFVTPVTLVHTFDAMAASAQTVKVQYYITTSTATTLKVYANSNDPIFMIGEKI